MVDLKTSSGLLSPILTTYCLETIVKYWYKGNNCETSKTLMTLARCLLKIHNSTLGMSVPRPNYKVRRTIRSALHCHVKQHAVFRVVLFKLLSQRVCQVQSWLWHRRWVEASSLCRLKAWQQIRHDCFTVRESVQLSISSSVMRLSLQKPLQKA